jgi:hypothetical protein
MTDKNKQLISSLDIFMERTYKAAERRGKLKHRLVDAVGDIVNECLEAVEVRNPLWFDELNDNKPEGFMAELADIFITAGTCLYQFGKLYNIPPAKVVIEKMEFNEIRED